MANKHKEAQIRDHLAANLALIEPGLTLIDKELMLPNDKGAKGFVDIFAKDTSGRLVIIEIKQSDVAARSAIQELTKYASLILRKFLVQHSDYRLLVLSTVWHELGTPFAEFVRATGYDARGGVIKVDGDGLPVAVHPFVLPSLPRPRRILPRHHIYEFMDEALAQQAVPVFAERFASYGIDDVVIVFLALKNKPDGVTHMVYVAQLEKTFDEYMALIVARHSPERVEEFLGWIEDITEPSDRVGEAGDMAMDAADNEAPSLRKLTGYVGYQISHPEKAIVWLNADVQYACVVHRFGRFRDPHLTDDTIIAELTGSKGESSFRIEFSADLALKPQVAALREALQNIFFFNSAWRGAVGDLISYAETRGATSIAVSAFNNDDILRTVAGIAGGHGGFVPRLDVDIRFADRLETYRGRIEWDGTSRTADEIADDFFDGKLDDYLMTHHFGADRGLNEDLMASLGLRYTIWRDGDVEERVRVRGASITSAKHPHSETLGAFVADTAGPTGDVFDLLMQADFGFRRQIVEVRQYVFLAAEEELALLSDPAILAKGLYWYGDLDTCDLCERPFDQARYMADAAVTTGAWGCFCALCFKLYCDGVGIGRGQIYRKDDAGWLQTAGGFLRGDDEDAE